MSNLFLPSTIDNSLNTEDRSHPVPGIKDEQDNWSLQGHPDRVISVNAELLDLFATVYDSPGTPSAQASLPTLHATQLVSALRAFVLQGSRVGELDGSFTSTEMWNETARCGDKTIRRTTRFPENEGEWILSGPHIFVASPLFQTPRRVCATHRAYDVLDQSLIPKDYLPRTNFARECELDGFLSKVPTVNWTEDDAATPRRIFDYYRLAVRKRLSQSGERTLIPSIIPPKCTHIFTIISTAFRNGADLLRVATVLASLPCDFFIKSTGQSDFTSGSLSYIPLLEGEFMRRAMHRIMSLNCVVTAYRDLWKEQWNPTILADQWSSTSPMLDVRFFQNLAPDWSAESALRSDFARRQALLEVDVLVALQLRMSITDLLSIYRVQFSVMRQYEAETFYDQNGRIIFTPSKGLTGVGLPRKSRRADLNNNISYGIESSIRTESGVALGWEDVRDLTEGVVTKTFMDDTLPDGPHQRTVEYVAPFFRPDREEDYRVAWEFFENQAQAEES